MANIAGPRIRAAAAGLGIGLAQCAVSLRIMRSALYGVSVYDWPSLLAVVGVLAAVALAAATIPTLRIASIDPATTLHEE